MLLYQTEKNVLPTMREAGVKMKNVRRIITS